MKAKGSVTVKVTVDENGNVTSGEAISHHPLLRQSAVNTAKKTKFRFTILSGKPVQVTGVIVFNFIP